MSDLVPDVAGVVLAGGHSRRFGTEKARHLVGGRRMIDHVVDAVAAVCPTVLVSLGAGTTSFSLTNVRYVRDQLVDAGPLAGIHAALQVIDTPWLLTAACDMPFITPAALLILLETRRPDVEAVVACGAEGRLHPLLACYRTDIIPQIASYLDGGRRSMHGFIDEISFATVQFDDGAALHNVNSPRDLPERSGSDGR